MTTDIKQRDSALQRANEARAEMYLLKTRIHDAGRVDGAALAAAVVLDGRTAMRFEPLLLAVLGVGKLHAAQMLGRAHINPTYRVDSRMVDRRRRMLLVDELLGLS